VTRPISDARPLAEKLRALGHEVMMAPLFTIRPRPTMDIAERPYAAVAFTSANAVRMIAAHAALERLKTLPAYTVGPQSAAEARRAGFANVIEGGGDARALIDSIANRAAPGGGPILYLSGNEISVDIAGGLAAAGFAVDRVVAYDTEPVGALPTDVALAIRDGTAQGVLLHSARAAERWVKCVAESGLEPYMEAIAHFCLSTAIAARLPSGTRRLTAERPEETSMFALLTREAGERS
jgi:uroporphyrinogen-III synthase